MSALDKWKVELNEREMQLRPPTIGMKRYEPKVIPLTTGEDMLVREARDEEIPMVLEAIKPLLDHEKDFYDIVSARLYAELLGKIRYRVQDEYVSGASSTASSPESSTDVSSMPTPVSATIP